MELDLKKSISYEDILKKISDLSLEGSCCMRYCGIQIEQSCDNGYKIIAWQCNMADIQNYDVKLPTVILMYLDNDRIIKSIDLMPNFKGSQGIACSRSYLDKKLKKILIGEKLTALNTKIIDPYLLCCRHTFELTVGAATLLDSYEEKVANGEICYTEELIRAYIDDNTISCIDKINVNDYIESTRIDVSDIVGNITYGSIGRIENVNGMKIIGYSFESGEWQKIKDVYTIDADSYQQYVTKIMKIVSGYWVSCKRKMGVKRNFYFSQIWGPTFFGILSQAIGIKVFNNNYAYFQHCIYGIQRNDNNIPLCIGVTDNIDEMSEVFEDFVIDDLY